MTKPQNSITIRLWAGQDCVVYTNCSNVSLTINAGFSLITFLANGGRIRVESTLRYSIERTLEKNETSPVPASGA